MGYIMNDEGYECPRCYNNADFCGCNALPAEIVAKIRNAIMLFMAGKHDLQNHFSPGDRSVWVNSDRSISLREIKYHDGRHVHGQLPPKTALAEKTLFGVLAHQIGVKAQVR